MLYHGTKVTPFVVMNQGLKPASVDEILREVMADFQIYDLYTDNIRDYIERKKAHLYVYLTDNYVEALSYARSGSNFRALIEQEFANAKRVKWNPYPVGYVYHVDLPGRGEVKKKYVSPQHIVKWEQIQT